MVNILWWNQGLVLGLGLFVALDLLFTLIYYTNTYEELQQFEGETIIIDHGTERTKELMNMIFKIESNVNELCWHVRDGLLTMRKKNATDDMDALVSNVSQWQQSVLADVANLHKLGKKGKSSAAKIESNVNELCWHLRDSLLTIRGKNATDDMDALVSNVSQWQQSVLVDIVNLCELDENGRSSVAKELSELMQRKLHNLQHPSNCASARKAVCSYDLGHGCGFGCFTHHLLHCFMVAYWTNRTLVLDTKGWIYSKEKGWEGAFLPVSNTCISAEGAIPWSADHSSHQIVLVTELQYMSPKPIYLPQSVPREFADRIFAFHEKPFVWFAGQFLSYLMRPNNEVKEFISNKKKSLGITKPYVGIQVRRTDKLFEEASPHSIDEYMVHVEEWYQLYAKDNKVDKKRVFIATDDPSVIKEARQKYSEYEVYGDLNVVASAQVNTRYSTNSLFGIISDVFVLAHSDFAVCTFSSNICRLVYELMQTYQTNAAKKCHSVDSSYFFFGQIRQNMDFV